MKDGLKFKISIIAFLASGCFAPAVAQDYCASLKNVIATAPQDFSPLFVLPPKYGQHYRVTLSLPGAKYCYASPSSTAGSYRTSASYHCEYESSNGNSKVMFDRMVAQTAACFGHSYRRTPDISPNEAAMSIFSRSGAFYVNEDGISDYPGYVASLWVEARSDGITVRLLGKKPKRD